ncbi:adenylate isopentenyltransferase 3, chloroplastic-like [Primulina huaijiensis]|uniref:adenylate isopentenyltransferase 3, chloroplastic-like n=1 Tax=Primulina huaijiensis TaxID=1492673 RepID=UPI003CC78877
MDVAFSLPKQIRPLLNGNRQLFRQGTQKEKVVVIIGATGTGKSRLSIDLATHFAAEVINSDKMQVYHGLDITTNKITEEERCGIPHHLLGFIHPDSDFSAGNFCAMASVSLKSILSRGQLPIIVGGSNSFIEAFADSNLRSKYEFCYLWVDVAVPVLHSFVSDRVDKMVERGMVEEVRDFFNPNADYSRGIRRAIGVSELDKYFRMESFCDEVTRSKVLAEAIDMIKTNTSNLARRQLEKINRLRRLKGWKVHRLDATEVFRKRCGEADEAWEHLVTGPGAALVSEFLYSMEPLVCGGMKEIGGRGSLMVTATR